MKITLGFSTCPNDTFIFDALVHGKIDTGEITYEVVLDDIFHLNQKALRGELDMVKVSYNTYGQIINQYQLLDAGSALGNNCGPLLISRRPLTVSEIVENNLIVGIPGKNTTANLLLGYYAPQIANKRELIFHEIMPALLSGQIDAGLIIHENRFTYQNFGLLLIQDLGEYWEEKTGLPIPLGAIVAKKNLGEKIIRTLQTHTRESVRFAFEYPDSSQNYVRKYAQEMDDEVMKAHINLYVNEYSLKLGTKGIEAVREVLTAGESMGLFPELTHTKVDIFE
ncbi:MAG: 1,4-dihydroxy-6-naphthoate synthase [Bacteroidia bacterium]|nr:1,4-dihydroxy-6-naphthoate synthase [Bacteroidia bacterium]